MIILLSSPMETTLPAWLFRAFQTHRLRSHREILRHHCELGKQLPGLFDVTLAMPAITFQLQGRHIDLACKCSGNREKALASLLNPIFKLLA